MNIDIIALAKEAGATIFYEISTNPTNNVGKISFTKQQLKKFSTRLKDEIRKEINKEINIAAIVNEDTDILMQEITALTEQNTKFKLAALTPQPENREGKE